MKKKLDTAAIVNELKGASAFFPDYKRTSPDPEQHEKVTKEKKEQSDDTVIPRHHDTVVSLTHDTMVSQEDTELLEVVRKAVKQIGKEAATHRFTEAEKEKLRELEFAFRKTGIRTSENEISRIAINFVVEDHRLNGEQSLLTKVLKRLNS